MPWQGAALVVDDTTLDKPYAREIELVTWHGCGKPGCPRGARGAGHQPGLSGLERRYGPHSL